MTTVHEVDPFWDDMPPDLEEEGRARPHLRDRVLHLGDLAGLPPVKPLIDGLLYRDTLAQMSGAPGSYKSFIALAMACSVATGQNFEGHRVPQSGTVLYVVAEGASGMHARTLAWCQAQQLEPAAALQDRLLFIPMPVQLGDIVDVSEAVELADEVRADLVVLDTRARCTLGLDENSSAEQGRAIAAADRIRNASGATVLTVHHSGRAGDHGRGSNAWDGAVWSDLRITGEELRAKIKCAKHKDVPDGCDHDFRMIPTKVDREALPRLDDESELEWDQRRSTLTVMQNSGRTYLDDDSRSVRSVADLVRTTAPPEGLTGPQVIALGEDLGVSRTQTYQALKLLVSRGVLISKGTERRTRYLATGQPTLAGEDS